MSHARFLVGDVYERMAELEDGSVDLILTSPPFLALRSYLPAGHPDKAKEIGCEATPAEFLDTLLTLTAEWRRLLAPHGSICVELGDTYSGSGGAGGAYSAEGLRAGQPKFRQQAPNTSFRLNRDGSVKHDSDQRRTEAKNASHVTPINGGPGWPLAKSLCGIPHLYHLSLAYGRNLLTGQPSPAGQWRVRNVVAWCRPNPSVGALGDKFRPATSYLTIACVSGSRYFDLDAVRTEHQTDHQPGGARPSGHFPGGGGDDSRDRHEFAGNPAGAPPLDWWEIPTAPYKGAHYAAFPQALCVRPIKAMCPTRVCVTCGEPSRRIVGEAEYVDPRGRPATMDMRAPKPDKLVRRFENSGDNTAHRIAPTLGFTDCGHDTWRPGLTLDPFAGSGTTLAVAVGHGRNAIGIDLDPRNADLARERVGMFLDVEYPEAVA